MEFDPSQFCMAGISHQTASLSDRHRYALNGDEKLKVYEAMHIRGASVCIVLSTCNRTEIYTDSLYIDDVLSIWSVIRGLRTKDLDRIQRLHGFAAVKHLFSVAGGIDSQIPGDLQIIQQVKDAFIEAKEKTLACGLLEKLINQAVHCSKRIKSETKLSTGISSVASAVTMLVRKYFQPHHRIVILGTGKRGKISCRNLIKAIPGDAITLINRTDAKAADLANELGVKTSLYEHRNVAIGQADIVIVATSAPSPIIIADQIREHKSRLIVDLTVPSAIDNEIADVPGIRLTNLDALSQIVSGHLGVRTAEILKAKTIVEDELRACITWWHRRAAFIRNAPQIISHTHRKYA
jgi:glutamyl-tRNA reductase